MVFKDRYEAGVLLAEKLSSYRGTVSCVLGLARGGVAVAKILADDLNLSLDVLVVKKIGHPGQEELAIGALAPDGVSHVDWRLAGRLGIDEAYIHQAISLQQSAISEKTRTYRKGRKPYAFREKTVIIIDDGAATGATIEVAIKWLRKKHAKRIVVALPIAPKELIPKIAPEVDELVVLHTPDEFSAVGQFYEQFEQVTDEEVVELLHRHSRVHGNPEKV